MPDQEELDRKNDARFLTPLLLMALVLACGILAYAYSGHPLVVAG